MVDDAPAADDKPQKDPLERIAHALEFIATSSEAWERGKPAPLDLPDAITRMSMRDPQRERERAADRREAARAEREKEQHRRMEAAERRAKIALALTAISAASALVATLANFL